MFGILIVLAILFAVGSKFSNYAKRNKLNPILWGILGPASYFIGQFVLGLIVSTILPDFLLEEMNLIIFALFSGIATVIFTYQIMVREGKKVKTIKTDSDILDQDFE